MMSLARLSETLATVLTVGLRLASLTIVGVAAAMIWAMEPSSASQGGRYYVAAAALVALLMVDRAMTNLVRRRLPFSLSTLPAEQRYHRRSFLVLVAAGVFLLGLAHYRTAGMSQGLVTLGLFGAALAAIPFVLPFVLERFVRPVFDRGIDLIFEGAKRTSAPKTWSFSHSIGAPVEAAEVRTARPTPVTVLPLQRVEWYRDTWRRILDEFEGDGPAAVRRAHALILELVAETGHSGILDTEERFEVSDPTDTGRVIESVLNRVARARDVEAAVQSVLAGASVQRDDLRPAMDEYGRILNRLLEGVS